MTTYRVELRGDVREVYTIEADSAEDAAARWHEGDLYLSEASGMEVLSVEVDE
jgi:hypothetical protein